MNWLSFWMTFPVLLIGGVNTALFYLVYIYNRYGKSVNFIRLSHKIAVLPVLIILASTISLVNTSGEGTSRSLAVLPNYIYWQILVISLVSAREYLRLKAISAGMYYGVIVLLLYFHFLNFGKIPLFLVGLSENTIALILISFSSPALLYCKNKYGLKRTSFLFVFVLFTLIDLERRAGTILTLFTVVMTLWYRVITIRTIVYSLLISTLIIFVSKLSTTEELVYKASPRLHQLAYNLNEVRTEDRSYLTRLLMIEKGLEIFEKNPITGVGLGNFRTQQVSYSGGFVGSEYVINKEELKRASSHNSYILFLAEGGLLLTIPFVCLLLYNIFCFVNNYNGNSQYENAFYWSFIGVVMANYFVNGILNSNTWYLIGITTAVSARKK